MAGEPTTKPELIALINERWDALQDVLKGLDNEAMDRQLPDGWSPKMHLAHITVWERSLLGLLRGQDRAEAMGIPKLLWDGHDTDAINGHVAEAASTMDLQEIRKQSLATHVELMEQLESMSQEDLERPYSEYQPGNGEYNAAPVGGWVHGNTWDHYNEHIAWLKNGLKG